MNVVCTKCGRIEKMSLQVYNWIFGRSSCNHCFKTTYWKELGDFTDELKESGMEYHIQWLDYPGTEPAAMYGTLRVVSYASSPPDRKSMFYELCKEAELKHV